MIGYTCKYTPVELLAALGGQPALLNREANAFSHAEALTHNHFCCHAKAVLEECRRDGLQELVLVNCCDTIRSAYDILKEFGNLDFLYLLDILHSQEGCSVQHARDQLLALAEAYGAYKGTQFDRAAFFAAFQSPPPVTGPHIAVLGAKMGSHLFSLVEETMPLPVENATCANNRRVAPPADQGDFAALMERLAQLNVAFVSIREQFDTSTPMGRAMMSNPKLVMLDEPSMGLAPILVEQIFDIIREFHAAGTTILLVEQNAKMALSISNRAYVLETGGIYLEGDAAGLLDNEQVKQAYLGA